MLTWTSHCAVRRPDAVLVFGDAADALPADEVAVQQPDRMGLQARAEADAGRDARRERPGVDAPAGAFGPPLPVFGGGGLGRGVSTCRRRSPGNASSPSSARTHSQTPCGRSSTTASGLPDRVRVAPGCPDAPPTGFSPFLRGSAGCFFSPSEEGCLLERAHSPALIVLES